MSDSEGEDYMSDKLLPEAKGDDVGSSLRLTRNEQREHSLYKKRLNELANMNKGYEEREQEARQRGLSTAISSDNVGFQLLEKMGYIPGAGLGKSTTGITEPVAIQTKCTAAGVGMESRITERIYLKAEAKKRKREEQEREFRAKRAELNNNALIQMDFLQGQKTCENLDLRLGIDMPEVVYFWRKQTFASVRKQKGEEARLNELKKHSEQTVEMQGSGNAEEQAAATEPEDITEFKLCNLIMYLRKRHNYCMYCGDYTDILSDRYACPGYFRKEHE